MLGVALCVIAGDVGFAQSPPVSADAVREQIERAAQCYDFVDYRCVISTLEGPLLARETLPANLSAADIETGYELLGMGYLAVGLEDDAERAFARLVDLRPEYRLERLEAAPEHVAMVERLARERRAAVLGDEIATAVLVRAQLVAFVPNLRLRSREVVAAMLGASVARHVLGSVRERAPLIVDPPWGPLQAPILAVGAALRPLVGSTAFDAGGGLDLRLGVGYRPLYVGVNVGWTRHESRLENPVILPSPFLDVVHFGLDVGLRDQIAWFGWGATVGVGGEWLHVSETLQSVNPALNATVEAQIAFGEGFGLRVGNTLGALFGSVTADDGGAETATSLSWMLTLGATWAVAP